MQSEKGNAKDVIGATLVSRPDYPRLQELAKAKGVFVAQCFDKDGNLKWEDVIENVVVTVGKNLALDTYLDGSAYTVVGPYMGLISSVGYTGVAAADTMASHSGWDEAGPTYAPDYAGDRKTCVWAAAAAGSKALSAALSFVFSETGTVKGCFIVYGTGAVATHDSTAGVLYSAGLFTGGDKAVVDTDTLNVSYTASL
jgi:hypothetical protein